MTHTLTFSDYFAAWGAGFLLAATFLGYGLFASRVLSLSRLLAPVLGSAFAALTATVLGALGLISAWSLLLFSAVGGGILAREASLISRNTDRASTVRNRIGGEERHSPPLRSLPLLFIGALTAVFIASRLILAAVPNTHPDALWYNLPAARAWFAMGRIALLPESIVSAQASYWDYLFLWPCALFPDSTVRSLLSAQIASQLLVVLLGYLPAGGVVFLLFRHRHATAADGQGGQGGKDGEEEVERIWGMVTAVGALAANEMLYTAATAKNDCGVLSWLLAGVTVCLLAQSARVVFVGGLLLGLACGAKLTSLFIVAPFLVLFAVTTKRWCGVATAVSGAAIPLVFFAIRNWLWTGNPVFPSLSGLFPSEYFSETWRVAMRQYDLPQWSSDALRHRVSNLFPRANPLTLFFLLPATFGLFSRRLEVIHVVSRTVLLAILLFLCATGSWAEVRLIGTVHLVIVLGAVTTISSVFARLLHGRLHGSRRSSGVAVCCFLALTANAAALTGHDLGELVGCRAQSASHDPRCTVPGSLPFELPPMQDGGRLAVVLEPRMYLLNQLGAVRLGDAPELDRALSEMKGGEARARLLCERGFQRLLMSKYSFDFFYNTEVALSFQTLTETRRDLHLGENAVETVLDLTSFCRAGASEGAREHYR